MALFRPKRKVLYPASFTWNRDNDYNFLTVPSSDIILTVKDQNGATLAGTHSVSMGMTSSPVSGAYFQGTNKGKTWAATTASDGTLTFKLVHVEEDPVTYDLTASSGAASGTRHYHQAAG